MFLLTVTAISVLLAARAGHHAVPGAADRAEGRGDHGDGAAGTAAAVVGAAAIVRHARRKGRS
ncbi:MAG TPA: hypothetical protein VHZ03_05440 [Trebonia sp.]|nr:hypothetical protein [Trebonia sp.]